MNSLDRQDRRLINNARTLGGALPVVLSDDELVRLCAVVAIDLDRPDLVTDVTTSDDLRNGYYGMDLTWLRQPVGPAMSLEQTFLLLKQEIPDFTTYFESLCAIHKRRLKFSTILERQALPMMEQIVPRCLLEYGLRPPETLASWLVWRKWLYDIDNRSAQETGYLFEPILASAIGGVPQSATNSPIRRSGNPNQGRQVDCLDSSNKLAYEFKMRVTIAASGQGRFQEELDFAKDCSGSGFTPILLVLDPTPSARLDDLTATYASYGGTTYLGDGAWEHIAQRAGRVMGNFVEKYVRKPLLEVDKSYRELQPIHLTASSNEIKVSIGAVSFVFLRTSAEPLVEETDDQT